MNTPGLPIPSWLLVTGGGGWFLPTYDLAWFFAELRYGSLLTFEMKSKFFSGTDKFGDSICFERTVINSHNPSIPVYAKGGALQGVAAVVADYPGGVQLSIASNHDLYQNFLPGAMRKALLSQAIDEAYSEAWIYTWPWP